MKKTFVIVIFLVIVILCSCEAFKPKPAPSNINEYSNSNSGSGGIYCVQLLFTVDDTWKIYRFYDPANGSEHYFIIPIVANAQVLEKIE